MLFWIAFAFFWAAFFVWPAVAVFLAFFVGSVDAAVAAAYSTLGPAAGLVAVFSNRTRFGCRGFTLFAAFNAVVSAVNAPAVHTRPLLARHSLDSLAGVPWVALLA